MTIDTDFGKLIHLHLHDVAHTGLIRLPAVPAERRIALIAELIEHHDEALEAGTIFTIRGGRIHISRVPPSTEGVDP